MNEVTSVSDAKKFGLTSNAIKFIAIIAMTVDHLTWLFVPDFSLNPLVVFLHIIGRITCPVMCYFIAEGYHYTHDVGKYTKRLFLFALLSHCPYVMSSFAGTGFVDWKSVIPLYYGSPLNQTSVMWSLAWGLVMLRIADSEKIKPVFKTLLVVLICLIAFISDWSCIASLCVLAFGTNRGNFKKQMLWMLFYVTIYSAVYFFAIDKAYGILQMAVVVSIPILKLYNGKRSNNHALNRVMKWLFYLYYPFHLLVIGLIKIFLF